MNIGFRRAVKFDQAELSRIERECYGGLWYVLISKPRQLTAMLRRQDVRIIVAADAADGNELCGFIVMRFMEGMISVDSLAVEIESRKLGIGSQLLGLAMAERSSQMPIVSTILNERLDGGLGWLSRRGFSVGWQKRGMFGEDSGVRMDSARLQVADNGPPQFATGVKNDIRKIF